MTKQIKVIDNFLSKDEFNHIKDTIFSSDFPWFYKKNVAILNSEHLGEYYFNHQFYINHNINSSFFKILHPILDKMDIKALIRCRANLYPNVNRFIESEIHCDFPYSHKGAVYYLNTNNGYTSFEDGTKIESVENRIAFFDTSIPHSASNCTDEKVRIILNFNYF